MMCEGLATLGDCYSGQGVMGSVSEEKKRFIKFVDIQFCQRQLTSKINLKKWSNRRASDTVNPVGETTLMY